MPKNFKDQLPTVNPALQFISQADPKPEPEATIARSEIPNGYKLNPMYVEKRTRRTHIVLTPSLFETISTEANKEGISLNEYIIRAIEAYNEGRTE